MKQLLVKERLEIVMTETGKTQEDVVGKVFKEIHAQIYRTMNKPIIQIETDEVYFENIQKVRKKKGVLSKGEELLEIKIRVVLLVKYLDIEKGGQV